MPHSKIKTFFFRHNQVAYLFLQLHVGIILYEDRVDAVGDVEAHDLPGCSLLQVLVQLPADTSLHISEEGTQNRALTKKKK